MKMVCGYDTTHAGCTDDGVATWDSPPKPDEPGYAEFVRAFNALLEARKVEIVPLTIAQQKEKDSRKPKELAVITNPGFEQDGQLMPFQVRIRVATLEFGSDPGAFLA